jgi:hypothetical protein
VEAAAEPTPTFVAAETASAFAAAATAGVQAALALAAAATAEVCHRRLRWWMRCFMVGSVLLGWGKYCRVQASGFGAVY